MTFRFILAFLRCSEVVSDVEPAGDIAASPPHTVTTDRVRADSTADNSVTGEPVDFSFS